MQLAALFAARKLLQLASPSPAPDEGGGEDALSTGTIVLYAAISVILVCVAGMMSGLTLGLLSIDKVDLEVIRRSGTERQRWLVSKIQPLLAHPHYLLVTLLLTNAGAMETLPIFLDRLINPVAAIIISVTAILMFGEIIPQAVCKRYGMEVGAYLAWFVRSLMLVTAPISYPIALLLDWLLGEHPMRFRRAELKALVDMHGEPQEEGGGGEGLTQDEVMVIQGALDMASKIAEAAMTPLTKVFMLCSDAVINDDMLKSVIEQGHSRVPVYEGSMENIVGMILVKELVLVDEDAGIRVGELRLREIPFLRCDIPMYELLRFFRSSGKHMVVLTREGAAPSLSPANPQEDKFLPGEGLLSRQLSRQPTGRLAQSRAQSFSFPPTNAQQPQRSSSVGLTERLPSNSSAYQAWEGAPDEKWEDCLAGSTDTGGPAAAAAAGDGVVIAAEQASTRLVSPRLSITSIQSEQARPIGIITIEDVLEELLQQEIVDETDRYVDNLQTTNVRPLKHMPLELRRFLTRTYKGSQLPQSPNRWIPTVASVAGAKPLAHAPSGSSPSLELAALMTRPIDVSLVIAADPSSPFPEGSYRSTTSSRDESDAHLLPVGRGRSSWGEH